MKSVSVVLAAILALSLLPGHGAIFVSFNLVQATENQLLNFFSTSSILDRTCFLVILPNIANFQFAIRTRLYCPYISSTLKGEGSGTSLDEASTSAITDYVNKAVGLKYITPSQGSTFASTNKIIPVI